MILGRFVASQNMLRNLRRKNDIKSMKIIDFGLSKLVKNVPKRHLKSKSKKTCDFVRSFYILILFENADP